MFNLSKKAATKFKVKWTALEEREGDYWRLDIVTVGRVLMLLIVHEPTLYSLVRKRREYKSLQEVGDEIRILCPWYRFHGGLSTGKSANRRLVGSVTEIRKMLWYHTDPDQTGFMEDMINDCLFSYLGETKSDYGRPVSAVARYMRNEPDSIS